MRLTSNKGSSEGACEIELRLGALEGMKCLLDDARRSVRYDLNKGQAPEQEARDVTFTVSPHPTSTFLLTMHVLFEMSWFFTLLVAIQLSHSKVGVHLGCHVLDGNVLLPWPIRARCTTLFIKGSSISPIAKAENIAFLIGQPILGYKTKKMAHKTLTSG